MDYYKVKLLLVILTSAKIIAAQNMNKLSYGELSEHSRAFVPIQNA